MGRGTRAFRPRKKTWLPVHENYGEVNVEKESSEEDSLLSTIRVLNKIRANEKSLQEGSLEIIGWSSKRRSWICQKTRKR